MADTKIQWAEKVWNPVTGCTKVSEGCRNCYAERLAKRLQGRAGYPKINPFDVTLHVDKLDEPVKWKTPQRIFVCSMGDLFHEKVPFWFIDEVFAVIQEERQHTFMVLTKRPDRMLEYFNESVEYDDLPIMNLWVGTSIEDQKAAEKRIPYLLRVPGVIRFLSCEPLLGAVDLSRKFGQYSGCPECGYCVRVDEDGLCISCGRDAIHCGLDWVIVGGESGPGSRMMNDEWVRSLRDQCSDADVAFFFKQWGEWIPNTQISIALGKKMNFSHFNFENHSNGKTYWRLGKKLAGNELDGKIYEEYPEITYSEEDE